MTAFDILDEIMLKTSLDLYGRPVTIFPMKTGAGGVNSKPEAETDPDRPIMVGAIVIRSEWSDRVQIGGKGQPTRPGAFKLAAAGVTHIATCMPSLLGWRPRKGDELIYDDRPETRYRLIEPMPDGGAGLHCGLSRIS